MKDTITMTVSVDSGVAEYYRSASDLDRHKIELMVNLYLHDMMALAEKRQEAEAARGGCSEVEHERRRILSRGFATKSGWFANSRHKQRTMRSWQYPWDLKINGATFALKTSTERADGRFQFNHIRPHRSYEAVLCLGIAPDTVLFDAWSKPDIARETSGAVLLIRCLLPGQ